MVKIATSEAKRVQGAPRRGETLWRNREWYIGSGQIVLPEPIDVHEWRAGMHDGPAHDAGKRPEFGIDVFSYFTALYIRRISIVLSRGRASTVRPRPVVV